MEINYGTVTRRPKSRDTGPVLATIDGRVSSLGNTEVVFLDTHSQQTHVMTLQVLQAMDACREFRPLDEHVARVASTIEGLKGQESAVRQVLLNLHQRGLLISDADFLARFNDQPASSLADESAVFIRACDRPDQLTRLCETLTENEQRHAGKHRYVVVDDSSDAKSSVRHADALKNLAAKAGVDVSHVGAKRWQKMIDDLLTELPERRDSVSWLLKRPTQSNSPLGGGIGRNAISLLSAGSRYLLLDDDFQLPLRRHPDYQPGLDFGSGGWAPHTYADRAAALSAGDPLESDPLAYGLSFCGRRLGELAAADSHCALDVAGLRGLSPSRTPMLRSDAFVASTVNGHSGDPGSGRLNWLYLLGAGPRKDFTATRERYLDTLSQPAVWYGTRRCVVAEHANFTAFGIDASRMMPCTMPHQRGEDALFGSLVRMMYPHSLALNLPYAIGHRQDVQRQHGDWLDQEEAPGMPICLSELARGLTSDLISVDPAQRLSALAVRLRDLCSADDVGLTRYLQEFLAYRRSLLVDALQRALQQAESPPLYWAADVRRLVEANGKALIDPPAIRFAGWPASWDNTAALRWFRSEALALASALDAWPAMWDVAISKRNGWLEWRG